MTRWVYDMDGTLVATRAANYAAYLEVGASPPDDFHIRPWQSWCSAEVHDRKNAALPRLLARHARLLVCAQMIQATGGEVLSNASESTYQAVVAVFPVLGQYSATLGMSPSNKLEWLLREQDAPRGPGVFLDDNTELVAEVRRRTRWQALDTSGF